MTSQELLQRLITRIPPPEKPDKVIGAMLHNSFGPSLSLPDDYRLFLDVYGPGWFTEGDYPTFEIFDLVSPAEMNIKSGDVSENVVQILLRDAQESHKLYPEMCPPAYPVIPGLLPWGDFDQGYNFYWWVDAQSNTWRVMVNAPLEESEMSGYECSMLEFLVINLTSLPGDKFFDDGEERFSGFMPSTQYKDYVSNYFQGGDP